MKLTAVVVGIFIRSRRLSLFDIAKMNVVICVSMWKSNLCRNYADSETGKLIFWKRTEGYLRSKIERFRNLPKNKKTPETEVTLRGAIILSVWYCNDSVFWANFSLH